MIDAHVSLQGSYSKALLMEYLSLIHIYVLAEKRYQKQTALQEQMNKQKQAWMLSLIHI